MDAVKDGQVNPHGSGVERPGTNHSLMPPCQAACPLQMNIGEYVDLVAQGKVMEALQVIREDNPFPSICAYVCTHPCQDACRRGQVDSPVAIRALKRFAVEFGGDRMIQLEGETRHAEKLAVVGSGPAGLACAYYLRRLGYPVTIFEAYSELGGMLRVGIPEYRLPREVLDIELQRLLQMGVEIKVNTRVLSLDLLFEIGYSAAFITVGAHQGLRMGIEGEESPGVIDGATFLREVNLGLKPVMEDRVGVVGGGNVAIDAARTAVRLGAGEVTILYRRSREEMPASPLEISQATEEGVKIAFQVAPTRIRREDGRLVVTSQRMEMGEPDERGRRRPVPVEGSEFDTELGSLITAIGQAPRVPEDFRLRTGRGSTIKVDPVTLTTNRAGVFAGGDAVTGPATVTEALAHGRDAAFRMDDYVQHRYPLPRRDTKGLLSGELLPRTLEAIKKAEGAEPPLLPAEERVREFAPVELFFDWESAVREARRCLRCGAGAEILFQDACATCLTCVRVCPYHVPYVDEKGSVQIPPDQCQACGICVAECPAGAIVLRKPRERRHVDEELEHVLSAAAESRARPFMVGFCCQYGLYGSGALAGLWRGAGAGVWIVPVLCVAKVDDRHIMRAFESGADGVFIAGCGEQCSRENTGLWVLRRVEKVRRVLGQIGLDPGRVEVFNLHEDADPVAELDEFSARIGDVYLGSVLEQEVGR